MKAQEASDEAKGSDIKPEDMTYFKLNESRVSSSLLEHAKMTGDMVLVKLNAQFVKLIEDMFAANRILACMSQDEGKLSLRQSVEKLGISEDELQRALRALRRVSI